VELNQIYDAAQSDQFELMNLPSWWSVIDDFNLGSTFRLELEQLSRRPVSEYTESGKTLSFLLDQGIVQKAVQILPFFQHLIIKCGDRGVLVVMRIAPEDVHDSDWRNEKTNPIQRFVVATGRSGSIIVVQHFPPMPIRSLVNVTGAGDSFVGALLANLAETPSAFNHPKTLEKAISFSQRAAVATLQCHSAVSPLLSELD
jgi:pseudouridine-5'-phosphate glycosidase/pseudouridine kinase